MVALKLLKILKMKVLLSLEARCVARYLSAIILRKERVRASSSCFEIAFAKVSLK